MTATDELRRLLDERGVEWWNDFAALHRSDYTHFEPDVGMTVCAWEKDRKLALEVSTDYRFTPEQAIAATLGETPTPPPPTFPKEPPYDLLIDLLRDEWDIDVSWDGLRRFWYVGLTDEGVRKRDEREATLGAGTCRYELKDGRFVCSSCGRSTWAYEGKGDPLSPPNYCPTCGAKVVDA